MDNCPVSPLETLPLSVHLQNFQRPCENVIVLRCWHVTQDEIRIPARELVAVDTNRDGDNAVAEPLIHHVQVLCKHLDNPCIAQEPLPGAIIVHAPAIPLIQLPWHGGVIVTNDKDKPR